MLSKSLTQLTKKTLTRAASTAITSSKTLAQKSPTSPLALNDSFRQKAITGAIYKAVREVSRDILGNPDEQGVDRSLVEENIPLVKMLTRDGASSALEKNDDNNFKDMLKRTKAQYAGNADAACDQVIQNMNDYPLEGIKTIHPTWVLGQDTVRDIFKVQEAAMQADEQLKKGTISSDNIYPALLGKTSGPITGMLQSQLIMKDKMSLGGKDGEFERVAEYEVDAAEQVPSVTKSILGAIKKEIYDGKEIPKEKADSITESVNNMMSKKQGLWFDLDGRKTTPEMVDRVQHIYQEKVTERLMSHADSLLKGTEEEKLSKLGSQENVDAIKGLSNYLERVSKNRAPVGQGGMGVYYNHENADKAEKASLKGHFNSKEEFKKGLEAVLDDPELPEESKSTVEKMVGITTVGYARKGAIHSRRDAGVYNEYVEDIYSLLSDSVKKDQIALPPSSESLQKMKDLTSKNPSYSEMDDKSKGDFKQLLGYNGAFFAAIQDKFEELPKDTQDGLNIMSEQLKHNGSFNNEIISESETIQDVRRVQLLQSIARMRADKFFTGDFETSNMQINVLVENKESLAQLGGLVTDALDNPRFRHETMKRGELPLVVSMSDNVRESGPLARVNVAKSLIDVDDALDGAKKQAWDRYNDETDPNAKEMRGQIAQVLDKVKVKALIGGGDGERNTGERAPYSTVQGDDIRLELAAPGSLEKTSMNSVGQKVGLPLMVEQMKELRKDKPELYSLLLKTADACTEEHNKFFQSHEFRKSAVSVAGKAGDELLSLANAGSRAAAKKDSEVTGSDPDVALIRAISGDTIKHATGLAYTARSLKAINDSLTDSEKEKLPELADLMILNKIKSYDTFHTIAMSDYSRAQKKMEDKPAELRSEIQQSRDDVVDAMRGASYFFTPEQGKSMRDYIDNNRDKMTPDKLAYGTMEASGSELLKQVAQETKQRNRDYIKPMRKELDNGNVRSATVLLRAGKTFRPLESIRKNEQREMRSFVESEQEYRGR